MAKSLDSTALASTINLYQNHGRTHRDLKTPTKIYTPEGTYEVMEEEMEKLNQALSVDDNPRGEHSDAIIVD